MGPRALKTEGPSGPDPQADIRSAVARGFRSARGVYVPVLFKKRNTEPGRPISVRIDVPFIEALGEALDQAHIVGLMLAAHHEPMMGRALSRLKRFEEAVADFLVERDALALAKLEEGL